MDTLWARTGAIGCIGLNQGSTLTPGYEGIHMHQAISIHAWFTSEGETCLTTKWLNLCQDIAVLSIVILTKRGPVVKCCVSLDRCPLMWVASWALCDTDHELM